MIRSSGVYCLADLPQQPPISEISASSGWEEFDTIFKLYPGQFTVVTGKAGSGKSTFLMNLMVQYARLHGMRSFMHVPENESSVEFKLRSIWGSAPGFDKFATEQCIILSARPEFYDDEPQTIQVVLDRAVDEVRERGIDFLVIDPWNELERVRPRDMLMSDYIGECLKYLKQFTRCMNVAVALVVHPDKSSVKDDKRMISLYDCDGGAAWANKADNGLVIHREPNGLATRVISSKVRYSPDAGQLGQCHFMVDKWTGIFTPQYGAVETL